jgi:hypothetical protein
VEGKYLTGKGLIMGDGRPPAQEAPDRIRDGIIRELKEHSAKYIAMSQINPDLPGLGILSNMLNSAVLPLPDICLKDERKLKLVTTAREALLAELAVEKSEGRNFNPFTPHHLTTAYQECDSRSGGGVLVMSKVSDLSAMRDKQVIMDIVEREFEEASKKYANDRLKAGMNMAGHQAAWEAREAQRAKEDKDRTL